jgi:amino acid transporter
MAIEDYSCFIFAIVIFAMSYLLKFLNNLEVVKKIDEHNKANRPKWLDTKWGKPLIAIILLILAVFFSWSDINIEDLGVEKIIELSLSLFGMLMIYFVFYPPKSWKIIEEE